MNPTPTAAPAPVGSPAEAIATIHEARRERWAASAREFMAVAAFADHYLDPDETPMVPGTERMLHWAGDGAPAVAEFCSLELMAALRISDAAAIGFACARSETGLVVALAILVPIYIAIFALFVAVTMVVVIRASRASPGTSRVPCSEARAAAGAKQLAAE